MLLRGIFAALFAAFLTFTPAKADITLPVGGAINGAFAFNVTGCTGLGDDAPAINALLDQARTAAANGTYAVTLNFPAQQPCMIVSQTLNFTGFTHSNLIVNFNGAVLYGRTTGLPVLDYLGSTSIVFNNLHMIGDGSFEPTYGVQGGRINTTASGDTGGNGTSFYNRRVVGSFSKVACYGFSNEGNIRVNDVCANADPAGYAIADDGYNHFNITSQFVTQLAPVDSPQSFNENTTISGHYLQVAGTGTPVAPIFWAGGRQHRMIGTYGLNLLGPNCVELYNIANGQPQSNDFDLHCEDASLVDTFLINGTVAQAQLQGFTFRDGALFATNSIFKLGGSVTSVVAQNFRLDVPLDIGNSNKVFDSPTAWTVGADSVYVGAATGFWNFPATFTGNLCLAGTCQAYSNTQPVAASNSVFTFNVNGDFQIDQVNEGAAITPGGARVTDGWINVTTAGTRFTYQRGTSALPSCYYFSSMSVTNGITGAPGASDRWDFHTRILGIDAAPLRLGTANANKFTVDLCIQGNASLTYPASIPFFINNNAAGGTYQTYIHLISIPSASTPFCTSFTVPGPTTGTFVASTLAAPALLAGFSWGCGSNFQTSTVDAWQTGQFYCTSGSTVLANTASGAVTISGVHIRLGEQNYAYSPHQPMPYAQELERARRRYWKSFVPGTKPAQNVGVNTGELQFPASIAGTGTQRAQVARLNLVSAPTTVTFYNPAAANANCNDETATADGGAATSVNATASSLSVSCTGNASTAVGNLIGVHVVADTGQ